MWQPLGSGINDYVYAITPFFSNVAVGGRFTNAGERASVYVAQWGPRKPGDFNCDGRTDMLDLAELSAHWLEP